MGMFYELAPLLNLLPNEFPYPAARGSMSDSRAELQLVVFMMHK